MDNARTADDNRGTTRNDNAGYTATRTADDATGSAGFMNDTTMWVWLILAVAAVIIVALVWYYATQNNTTDTHHDE